MNSKKIYRGQLHFLTLPYQLDSTRVTLRRYDPTNRYCAMISNHGNVWVWARGRLCMQKKYIFHNPALTTRGRNNKAYLMANIGYRYSTKNHLSGALKYLHRCVATVWVRVPRKLARLGVKLQVDHRNGDRFDNRPQNLRWCTASQNMRYSNRARKGLPV